MSNKIQTIIIINDEVTTEIVEDHTLPALMESLAARVEAGGVEFMKVDLQRI